MTLYFYLGIGLLIAALSGFGMVEHSSAVAARAQRDSAQTEVKRLNGVEAQLATANSENEQGKAALKKCGDSVQELGAQARLSKKWAEQRVAEAEAGARKRIDEASAIKEVPNAKPEDACTNAAVYWKQFKGAP